VLLAVVVCAVAGLYQLAAILAAIAHLRRREPEPAQLPPVSILKPVRGLDAGFYEAIRSHAELDYPDYEILFGFADPSDPAIAVIERLRAEFPHRAIRVVRSTTDAPNGKVGVLIDLARQARHPLLLVNDSDIRVQPDYLRRIVAPLEDPTTGLVTCLYRATAASLPGRLEALGIATDFVPGTLVAPWTGVREFALGSTLLFRAADLARLGGFEALAAYLADDYQLARRLTAAGLRVHLAKTVVQTSLQGDSWRAVWQHQLRWMRTIRVSRLGGYLGLPVTFATLWALLLAATGFWPISALLLGLRMTMGLTTGLAVLRCPVTARCFLLIPLRDLLGVTVWAAALFGDTVRWRDRRLRLHPDGRISPC
jgi:ceramide glucosyltransferase